MSNRYCAFATLAVVLMGAAAGWCAEDGAELHIRSLLPVNPISRAERVSGVAALLENTALSDAPVEARLVLPEGLRLADGEAETALTVPSAADVEVWQVEAPCAGSYEIVLELHRKAGTACRVAAHGFSAAPGAARSRTSRNPSRRIELLVGAHHYPLWRPTSRRCGRSCCSIPNARRRWAFTRENTRSGRLGDQVAVEHGIDFFIYCWYRTSRAAGGNAVQRRHSRRPVHRGTRTKCGSRSRGNQARGKAGGRRSGPDEQSPPSGSRITSPTRATSRSTTNRCSSFTVPNS